MKVSELMNPAGVRLYANIKEAAERVLGRSLEQNLLSIVFDYDGNLWFVTGGFRIYPSRGQQGAMGYISHNAIETILAGGTADLDHEVPLRARVLKTALPPAGRVRSS